MDFDNNKENEQRKTIFNKGLEESEARRKRGECLLDLRRNQREETIAKKRQFGNTSLKIAEDDRGAKSLSIAEIPQLYTGIMSNDTETQYNCTLALRKIISNRENPPIDEVISSGALPRLVEFLARNDEQRLQYESAWILTNVASGTSDHVMMLLRLGAFNKMAELLNSPSLEVAEQACWAIGNIAGDKPEFRDELLKVNALRPLLNLYNRTSKESVLRTATWTLSNLCRGKPEPDPAAMKECLPYLVNLITISDIEVASDAAWAISFICDENTEDNRMIQLVIDSGVVPTVINMLCDSKLGKKLKMAFMRILGNIVTGSDEQTELVIKCNGIQAIKNVMECPVQNLRKEACWAISNIAVGDTEHVRLLINGGLVKRAIEMYPKESSETKNEITWIIANVASCCRPEFTEYLVNNEVLVILCKLLVSNNVRTLLLALEAVYNILLVGEQVSKERNISNKYAEVVEEQGGLDKLEELQKHRNEEVYSRSSGIIYRFFTDTEESMGVEELAPAEKDNVFSFMGSSKDNKEIFGGKQFNFK